MTLASALYGGGGIAKYRSGNLYPANPAAADGGTITENRDLIFPFIPRLRVTVDRVAWCRQNTTAGNVYVGLYSSAGVLLTDCAVDSVTTAGWHLVDTTDVTLLANEFYWLCANSSAAVITSQSLAGGASAAMPADNLIMAAGLAVGIGTANNTMAGAGQFKARSNAALLANLTMSGFTLSASPMMGIVAA
jgi:hypothetical protein